MKELIKAVFNIIVLIASIVFIVFVFISGQITPGEMAILAAVIMIDITRNGD